MNDQPFAIIGIPIDSVGGAGGTELSPARLRAAGAVEALVRARPDSIDLGDLDVAIRDRARDPSSGIIGYGDLLATTRTVRASVREALNGAHRPFLLGGCCAEAIGALAGARDHFGRVGLAYLDGHLDLYDGRTSPTGEAADMPLAMVLGRAPKELAKAIGPAAPVRPEDVRLMGYRDGADAASHGSLLPKDFGGALVAEDVARVRAKGPARAGALAVDAMGALPFWLHLDVDILDERASKATDYLLPDGLDWDELAALLAPIGRAPALAGVSIACYNPEKDPDGAVAGRLVETIGGAFV
jgi:arginase